MPAGSGYSGTPLAKKLGIKPGSRVKVLNAPDHYVELLSPLPAQVAVSSRLRAPVDICHFFTRRDAELVRRLPELQELIRPDAALWVSWPKRTSGVATDVTEDRIRARALALDLVDVKVCAVDEIWSGLKLVIRRELR